MSKESENSIYSIPFQKLGRPKADFIKKKPLKTRSIPSHFKNKAGQRPILSKESKTQSIQSNFKNWAGQRPILSKESKNSIYSIPFQKLGRAKADFVKRI